jgi:L-rhamnose-H+ transport protein
MDSTATIGVLLYMAGGLLGASFYLPLKKVKGWAWESFWLIYAVTALLVVPWALAVTYSPNVFSVLKAAEPKVLLQAMLFGAMWGLGGLTWGLGIRYLGVGLGLAIACGSCAAFGMLIPPIVQGTFGELLKDAGGRTLVTGMGISLLGIVITGMAGMSKERELSEEQKKAAVAEFDFKKGLVIAVFSGAMSAGMEFGMRAADPIKELAKTTAPVPEEFWRGLPVLVVILLGGFTVNFVWCLFLGRKNKTSGDLVKVGPRWALNLVLAAMAGAIWYGQMLLYTAGDTKIGDWAFAGWSIIMSSQILFSTVLGILLKEWKGSSGRTKFLLVTGLIVLIASMAVIGYAKELKPPAPGA